MRTHKRLQDLFHITHDHRIDADYKGIFEVNFNIIFLWQIIKVVNNLAVIIKSKSVINDGIHII